MIKAIIFDWGNVIKFYDNERFSKIISKKFNVDAEIFKQVELKHRLRNDFGEINTEKYIEEIEKELGIDKKAYTKLWFSKDFSSLNKDLIQIIRKLRKQYKIFILSNGSDHSKMQIEKMDKISHLFDKVLFSYEVMLKKPDRRIFRKLLAGTTLKPSECIFVDDREDNVIKAIELGMRGMVYKTNKKLIRDFRSHGINIK